MRVGIIDMGTNSLRLDIYQLTENAVRLHREKVMARLGQEVFVKRELHPEAIDRAVKVLRRFQRSCEQHGVEQVVAVGTSAMREAVNARDLIARILHETGIEPRVISGEEEASLILEGIVYRRGAAGGPFCFVDIGGGSTEVGMYAGASAGRLSSLPLGAARLTQHFLVDGASAERIDRMRAHIRSVIEAAIPLRAVPETAALGTSGTVRAVSALISPEQPHCAIEIGELAALTRRIALMRPPELLAVPGMNPNRIDIIVPGSIVLEEVMSVLGIGRLEYVDSDLRDGLLARLLGSLEHERLAS